MTKKKLFVVIAISLIAIVTIWGGMLMVDYNRCIELKDPLFAPVFNERCDCGSGTYHGLFYTIDMEKYISIDHIAPQVSSVKMELLGTIIYSYTES